MTKILVSGLINIETTLRTEQFPLVYEPVRYPFFGINTTVAGVGYNISKALVMLGDEVCFLSIIGRDTAATLVQQSLAHDNIPASFVVAGTAHTAQSVIIYDKTGKRQIHTDLKDIQEQTYPKEQFQHALAQCSLAILCNINFSRPFLQQAQKAGKRIATDVHTIASLDDAYNQDFMAAADILFMSDERLPCAPEAWARKVQNRYGPEIIVIGLGEAGALLAVKSDGFMERITAVKVRPIVNTIGAGDALFSAFNHVYNQTQDPYQAIQKAVVFAAYKIGVAGAAEGFLRGPELDKVAASFQR